MKNPIITKQDIKNLGYNLLKILILYFGIFLLVRFSIWIFNHFGISLDLYINKDTYAICIQVLLGAGAIWLAFETYMLKKSAEEQKERDNKMIQETIKQNQILMEQVLIIRGSHEFEMKKELSIIEPVFVFDGGSYGKTNASLNCINKGGPIRKVRIVTDGNFSATISPTAFNTDDKFHITLGNMPITPSNKVIFEIEYENKLAEIKRRKVEYNQDPSKMGPKEVNE